MGPRMHGMLNVNFSKINFLSVMKVDSPCIVKLNSGRENE